MSNAVAQKADTLVNSLQNKALYPHEIAYFKLLQTHISWVILTGQFAYKIKKPVNFGFLDYTQLKQRKLFCEKELMLNQQLAKPLYLEVLAIYGTPDKPNFKGDGPIIDYALKMREFSQDELFSEKIKQGKLSPELMYNVTKAVAHFHLKTPVSDDKSLGEPEMILKPVSENFDEIKPLLKDAKYFQTFNAIKEWSLKRHESLKITMTRRNKEGFVKQTHGDLHLGNITQFEGQILIFDRIEFNELFRNTDTISDVAFLAMDLFARNEPVLAFRFISDYAQLTGDYDGLRIFRYHMVYRAVVRAKVALLENDLNRYERYANLALKTTQWKTANLILLHGFSGSGKSTYARWLADLIGAVIIQSDYERKRLFDVKPNERIQEGVEQSIYTPQNTQKVYTHMAHMAKTSLYGGFNTIIDATFLKRSHRNMFAKLAEYTHARIAIIHLHADTKKLQQQLAKRNEDNSNISDATPAVLEHQLKNYDALCEDEQFGTIDITIENMHSPSHLKTLKERNLYSSDFKMPALGR